jgi:hypothetical protein
MVWILGGTIISYTIVLIWPDIKSIYGKPIDTISTHIKNQNTLK